MIDHRWCKIVPLDKTQIHIRSQQSDMGESQINSASAASIPMQCEVPFQPGITVPPTAPPESLLAQQQITAQHDDYSLEYKNCHNDVPPPSYESVVRAPTVDKAPSYESVVQAPIVDCRTAMNITMINPGQSNLVIPLSCDANNTSAIEGVPSLTLESSVPVRTDTDKKQCCIVGVIFLTNGNIVIADNKNKKVKRLDGVELCLLREAKFDVSPFGIAEVPLGNLAVTFPRKQEVLFLGIENLNTTGRRIKLDQPCLGVAYAHDMMFVICEGTWRHSGVIQVFGPDDQLLYKLKEDSKGKDIIGVNTKHLSVFPETGHLMFSTTNERIHVITPRGELVWREIILDGSESAKGSTVLGEGVVVVVNNGLKFFDPKYRGCWRHLIGYPDTHPYAVAVNKDNSKLIMTQTKNYSDSIDELELDSIRLFKVSYP